jgi:hypothetical protein
MNIVSTIAKGMSLATMWFILNSLNTTNAFGQDVSKVNCRLTPSTSEKSALLSMSNLEGKRVSIIIKDEAGYNLMNEQIEGKNHYASILNLNQLKSGQYIFSYSVEGIERSSKFEIEGNSVVVMHPEKLSKFHKPLHCRITENQLDVFVDNENKEPLKVRLYDQNGNLVFSGRYNDEEASQQVKRFDLGKLATGEYKIAVLKGKNSYTGSISIN